MIHIVILKHTIRCNLIQHCIRSHDTIAYDTISWNTIIYDIIPFLQNDNLSLYNVIYWNIILNNIMSETNLNLNLFQHLKFRFSIQVFCKLIRIIGPDASSMQVRCKLDTGPAPKALTMSGRRRQHQSEGHNISPSQIHLGELKTNFSANDVITCHISLLRNIKQVNNSILLQF